MNYDSCAPNIWKTALLKWYIHRAELVCSSKQLFHIEIEHLRNLYRSNGYPDGFFNRVYDEYQMKRSNRDAENGNVTTTPKETDTSSTAPVLKVPYVGKPSILFVKRMRRVLKQTITREVRFVYTTSKVKDHFRVKDTDPRELLTQVVYSFKCRSDPDVQYIGYTNRTLGERVKEHSSGGTRVSDHIANCDSCGSSKITTDDFTIIKKCRNWMETAVYEALYIKRHNPCLNKQLVKPGYSHNLVIFN